MSATLSPQRNPIIRYWHGHGSLWEVFWLYGVATSIVLAAVFAVAVLQAMQWLQLAMIAVFACYTAWIVVSVWRCAPNVGDQRLMPIARWLTVAWALNTIFVLGFLVVDLFVVPAAAG